MLASQLYDIGIMIPIWWGTEWLSGLPNVMELRFEAKLKHF